MSNGESAGEPKSPDLDSHLVLLPLVFLDDVQAGGGDTCTSMRFANWHSQMVDLGGQNLVSDNFVPQIVYHRKCPVAVANPVRFSTATTFLRRALQAPQMQNARVTSEQAWQYTLHSLEATMLSIAKQVDVPEHHRAEQGDHRQHGGRASVRLYSRDDVWEALACQQFVVQRVTEGFRPLTAQGRGAQIPLVVPTVKIDPLTIPMEVIPNGFDSSPFSRTKAAEVRVATFRGIRRAPKLQTPPPLLPSSHSGERGGPTDSSLTSSESSTPEENPPTGQQTPGASLFLTNVLTGVVHVAVTAPARADTSRSLEYDGKRLQTASRCRLKLPATCYMIQQQPPLSLILCQTRACQAAVPMEPVKTTANFDASDYG